MKTARVAAAMLAVLLVAQARGQTTTASASASAPGEPKIVEDKSLTTAEYVKLGMPAPDKPWTGQEYKACLDVLEKLAKGDVRQLPRFGSRNSGDVFARMTSPENLKPLYAKPADDKPVPLFEETPPEKRLLLLLELAPAAKDLFEFYTRASLQASARNMGVFDSELIECRGLALRVSVPMPAIAKELADEPPSDDSDVAAGRASQGQTLARFKSGYADMMYGALVTLSDAASTRKPDRLRLANHLKETMPFLLPEIQDVSKRIIQTRLTKALEAQQDSQLAAAMADLLQIVKPAE